jgi:hypothetical protein
VINIEPEQVGPSLDLVRADLLEFGEHAQHLEHGLP